VALDPSRDYLLGFTFPHTGSIYRIVGDGCNLPLRSEIFDVVVCGEVVEHLLTPDAFIDEVLRVLKPKGLLVMTTPNGDRLLEEHPSYYENRLLEEHPSYYEMKDSLAKFVQQVDSGRGVVYNKRGDPHVFLYRRSELEALLNRHLTFRRIEYIGSVIDLLLDLILRRIWSRDRVDKVLSSVTEIQWRILPEAFARKVALTMCLSGRKGPQDCEDLADSLTITH